MLCFLLRDTTIALTEDNQARCLAALHQTSCDIRFDIVFLELVLLYFAENRGIKLDADLVRSLLGSRAELRTGAVLVHHRGRFLNRLLESGDTCYKYMGCASGLAAASVIHGGEGLVGPYCGGWQLKAMGLQESRPDTLQSTAVENTMSMRILKNGSVLFRRPPSKVYISSSAAIMSGTKR